MAKEASNYCREDENEGKRESGQGRAGLEGIVVIEKRGKRTRLDDSYVNMECQGERRTEGMALDEDIFLIAEGETVTGTRLRNMVD